MKQNITQAWETKINKILSNFLNAGWILIIISLIIISAYSDGDKYLQEWNGGPIAAIGIVLLAAVFATKKVVYKSEKPEVEQHIIKRKSIIWGFIYSIAFIMVVTVLAMVVNMIFFFGEGSQKYSQATVTYSSLSSYSLLASIFLSLIFSPILAIWIAKKKVQFRDEDYNQKLVAAHNYEHAMNYDSAIAIYEELGLWDDAKRCREKKAFSGQK